MEGAKQVIAVERDQRALAALAEIEAAYPGRLTVIAGDALAVNWASTVHGPAKIVANLPYNIGTPLLTGWLTEGPWPPWFSSLTLMFQKEVADRIAAAPGSEHYGRLTVLCQWRCTVHKMFDVHRLGPDDAAPQLWRYRLDTATGTATAKQVSDIGMEFPRVDERLVGRRHRYGYGAEIRRVGDCNEFGGNLVLIDTQTDDVSVVDLGAGRVGGEWVMAR